MILLRNNLSGKALSLPLCFLYARCSVLADLLYVSALLREHSIHRFCPSTAHRSAVGILIILSRGT